MAAQPREMVVGNIVRRVLGLIRDEAEDDREAEFTLSDTGSESQPQTPRAPDGQFGIICCPQENEPGMLTPQFQTQRISPLLAPIGPH